MRTRTHRRAGLLVAGTALIAGVVLPRAAAEPTTTATSEYSADQYGYVDTGARCDDNQTLMEFGRTSRALVAICVAADGQLEYRAVRLSDKAEASMPASRESDGAVVATNDSVTYTVSKESIVVADGDQVLYRDPWIEFRQPRFPSGPAASSTSAPAPSSTTAVPTPPVSTTTVSTTTVTPTPSTQG